MDRACALGVSQHAPVWWLARGGLRLPLRQSRADPSLFAIGLKMVCGRVVIGKGALRVVWDGPCVCWVCHSTLQCGG